MHTLRCLILFLFSFPVFTVSASYTIDATIEADVLADYQTFLAGRDPLLINDYSGVGSRRDVVEAIILQQAIALGGEDVSFNLVAGHYDARNLVLLKKGRLLIGMDTVWYRDAESLLPDVHISSPLLDTGENFAGLYVLPTNEKALAARSVEQVQQLVGTSSKYWKTDWQAMNELKLKGIVHEQEWGGMLSHIFLGSADFVLAPFQPNQSLEFNTSKGVLVPIPNVKVLLRGSRHFVISKGHPNGNTTYQALEKGLAIMRTKGTIKKAYQQAGFISEQVTSWQLLNP